MLRAGEEIRDIFLILSGVTEHIDSKSGLRNALSAGALMGELAGFLGEKSARTFRAASHVTALRIPREIYVDVVRRNALDETIWQVHENHQILQDSWLFGETVSYEVQHHIVRLMQVVTVGEGEAICAGGKSELFLIAEGLVTIFSGSKPIENVKKGEFFGEETVLHRSSGLFEACVTYDTVLLTIPGEALEDIPIVQWKLAETFDRRLKSFRTQFAFEWRDMYRVGIPLIDEEHEKLFAMIASLANSSETPAAIADLESRTATLVEAVRAHLGYEQKLLRERGSPDYDSQRKIHESFLAQIEMIRGRIPGLREVAVREMVDVMKDWIVDHTLLEDRKYKHLLGK